MSQTELKLCNSMEMAATTYITLKTVLLSGGGDHSYAIKPEQAALAGGAAGGGGTQVDSVKRFMKKAGWLAGN